MARLLEQHSRALDAVAESMGRGTRTLLVPEQQHAKLRHQTRLCALALRELGIAPAPDPNPAAPIESLLLQRCALPAVEGVTVRKLLEKLASKSGYFNDRDNTFLWLMLPLPSDPRTQCLLNIRNVSEFWLRPMDEFCSSLGPASPDQRAEVHELLCRCGWKDETEALTLVLDTLQWDSVPLLHFALELLRLNQDQLWLPLAQVLGAEFGTACRCANSWTPS